MSDVKAPKIPGRRGILLHLLPFAQSEEEYAIWPKALTQGGIAESIDDSKGNVSKYLLMLEDGGMVENLGRMKAEGFERTVNIYALTDEGQTYAELLKDQMSESARWLLSEEVQLLRQLAWVYRRKGSFKTAVAFLDSALRIAREWKMPDLEAIETELGEVDA